MLVLLSSLVLQSVRFDLLHRLRVDLLLEGVVFALVPPEQVSFDLAELRAVDCQMVRGLAQVASHAQHTVVLGLLLSTVAALQHRLFDISPSLGGVQEVAPQLNEVFPGDSQHIDEVAGLGSQASRLASDRAQLPEALALLDISDVSMCRPVQHSNFAVDNDLKVLSNIALDKNVVLNHVSRSR